MQYTGAFPKLQFANDPVSLAEWFIASLIIVAVVTFFYLRVLNKSPPPEGQTVAKLEQTNMINEQFLDPLPLINSAEQALASNMLVPAVENSAQAATLCLYNLANGNIDHVSKTMGLSDLAYLVQSKAKTSPQIAEPSYQLNSLRLRALQNQIIDQKEASWALSFAKWLIQAVQENQVKF
ncbi:MAG: hypothetical protein ACYCQJ_08930 [Nitrososphaerales archaeon]